LEKFIEDESASVQIHLAKNKMLTEKLMLKMVEKSSAAALLTLIKNPNATPIILEKLAEHSNSQVSSAAQTRLAEIKN